MYYQTNKMDEFSAKGNEKNEEAGGLAEEIFYNIKTVQSFGNVSYEINRYKEKIQECFEIRNQGAKILAFIFSIIFGIGYLGCLIIYIYSTVIFKTGDTINGKVLQPGTISLLLEILFTNTVSIMDTTPNIKAIVEACNSASDFFKLESDTEKKKMKKLENGEICEIFDSSEIDFFI